MHSPAELVEVLAGYGIRLRVVQGCAESRRGGVPPGNF